MTLRKIAALFAASVLGAAVFTGCQDMDASDGASGGTINRTDRTSNMNPNTRDPANRLSPGQDPGTGTETDTGTRDRGAGGTGSGGTGGTGSGGSGGSGTGGGGR